MDKNNFIVFLTKTNWNEVPRIRHQVANLLRENGKKIIFFEKTSHRITKNKIHKIDEGFYLVKHYEPLHHQLKHFTFFNTLNDRVVIYNIKKALKNFEIDFIVNFNYDYSFVKDIFPNKQVITIINDDFVAQAKEYRKSSAQGLLEKTCSNSDMVLGVSYSLVKTLKNYNKNTKLFLPWAQKKYTYPSKSITRDIILFYGTINYRIDWKIIDDILLSKLKVRFVGPIIGKKDTERIKILEQKFSNFEYRGTSSIDNLDCDDVIFSIIPYKADDESIKAITINNKSFNLLSKGLPLVYPKLENLIKVDGNVILQYHNIKDILKIYDFYQINFYNIQDYIKTFLLNHYSNSRYKEFNSFIQPIQKEKNVQK